MVTKFVSCRMGWAHRLPFFVGCAASVLVVLQTLASGAGSAATESLTGNNSWCGQSRDDGQHCRPSSGER